MTAPSHSLGSLRVLHVVTAYYPAVRYGGTVRAVHGLASALAHLGHEVQVYTTSMDGPQDLDVPIGRALEQDGVAVHYFKVPALRRLFWAPGLVRQLRQCVAGFDVVHVHGVFLPVTSLAARIAGKAGVPYILSPHGMLGRDVIRRRSRWVKRAWIELIERATLRRACALHVSTALEAEEIRALGLTVPARVLTIPSGIDYPPRHLPLSETPFAHLPARYVLFLSRISWKKGLEPLITAWRWVKGVPLVIAGNDEEDYLPRLRSLASSLGLEGRVLFVGPASDQHKWALYESAQLFVLPSYSENFGIVVGEAMAMGCPVVVTPEVGLARLVESQAAGLVTRNEPRALAAAVTRLLQDEGRRQELGRRGRDAVARHLSWGAVARQMEAGYERALVQGERPTAAQEAG
jgi:glycosyltransferase involved in cell wall biosynthesis